MRSLACLAARLGVALALWPAIAAADGGPPSGPTLSLPPIELGPGPVVIPSTSRRVFAGASPLGLQIGPRLGLGLRGRLNGPDPGAAFALDLGLAATYGGQPGDRPWLLRIEATYSLTTPPLEHVFALGPSAVLAWVKNDWSTAFLVSFGPRAVIAQLAPPIDSRGFGFRYGGTIEAITFNGRRTSGLFIAAEAGHQVLFTDGLALHDLRLGLVTGLTFGSGTKGGGT
ncbi:MAG: hypothetical protein U1A78_30155 [Polyangia bacterium]